MAYDGVGVVGLLDIARVRQLQLSVGLSVGQLSNFVSDEPSSTNPQAVDIAGYCIVCAMQQSMASVNYEANGSMMSALKLDKKSVNRRIVSMI